MDKINLGEVIQSDYFSETYNVLRSYQPIMARKLKLFSLDKEEIDFLLGKPSHPLIIDIIDIIDDFILMENSVLSLENFLHGEDQKDYHLGNIFIWCLKIAEGLKFVHSLNPNLAYGRLGTDSILISKNLKIGGLPMNTSRFKYIMPDEYVSPEIIKRDGEVSQKCDVYSFGILLWECLSRKRPYYHVDRESKELSDYILEGERPPLSDIYEFRLQSIEGLIEKCWSPNVIDRPSSKQLMSYINKFYGDNFPQKEYVRIKSYLGVDVPWNGVIARGVNNWLNRKIFVRQFEIDRDNIKFSKWASQLKCFNHENILKTYGIVRRGELSFLLMEYSECGSLFDYLHGNQQQEYSVHDAIHWMHQVAKGTDYLLNGIKNKPIRGHLKSQNMMLFDNFKRLKIKLSGVRLSWEAQSIAYKDNPARILSYMKQQKRKADTKIHSLCYMAPEVMAGQKCSEKSDVYSFGIVFWEVLAQKNVFYQLKDDYIANVVSEIINDKRPDLADIKKSEFKCMENLLELCWNKDPKKRPSIDQLIKILNNPDTLDIEFEKLKPEVASSIVYADITIFEEIGRGTFGKVYRAICDGYLIALKKCEDIIFGGEKTGMIDFVRDYELLASVDHENIVKYYETVYDNKGIPRLLMEFAECGSLHDYLHGRERKLYTMEQGINWMIQCAKGISHLHSIKPDPIIHRNLNATKLLFTSGGQILKVGGFGIKTELVTPINGEMVFDKPAYMAPEVLKGENFSEKCDIYSFGIILWEVMTGIKPFHYLKPNYLNPNVSKIMNLNSESEHPPLSNTEIIESGTIKIIMEKCWNLDPDKRPEIEELVSDLTTFFKSSDSSTLEQFINIFIDIADIKMKEKIGEGAFGATYKANWHSREIAIKKFNNIDGKPIELPSFAKQLKNLYPIYKKNIVEIYGIAWDSEFTYLLMNYIDDGFPWKSIFFDFEEDFVTRIDINFMYHVAKGMDYLQRKSNFKILHGNLKPQNMLINYQWEIKLSDYLCPVDLETLLKTNPNKVAIAYVAPEVLDGGKCTEESDVYSFGIVFWELLTQKKPFDHLNNLPPAEIISKIINGERPNLDDIQITEVKYMKELLKRCWNKDPKKRPSMEKLIKILRDSDNFDIEIEKFQSEVARTVDFANITLFESIGSGAFGTVYRAIWRGKQIALKTFDRFKNLTVEQKAPLQNEFDKFEKEVELLSRADHVNIVKLYGIVYENEKIPCLLMDFAECGSLHVYLHGKDQREYTMADGIAWMIHCVQGISYLHAMKPKPLIHRDLKPQNLLLTDNYRMLKIGDFGTATELRSQMTGETGTVSYMAPEVLKGEKYTEKCDIYSFGIILWEVSTRQKPYHHLRNPINEAILFNASSGERPKLSYLNTTTPDQLKTLITQCWHQYPKERPTVEEIQLESIRELFTSGENPNHTVLYKIPDDKS